MDKTKPRKTLNTVSKTRHNFSVCENAK